MQCPKCGKTDRVTISNKTYCANCGTAIEATASPAAPAANQPPVSKPLAAPAAPITQAPARMTDIARPDVTAAPTDTTNKIQVTNVPAPAASAGPTPLPTPKVMSDIKPVSVTPLPAPPQPATPKPAQEFHGNRLAAAFGNVFARRKQPTQSAALVTPAAPAAPPASAAPAATPPAPQVVQPAPTPPKPQVVAPVTITAVTPAPPPPAAAPEPAPAKLAVEQPVDTPKPAPSPSETRLIRAAAAAKSPAIKKFSPPAKPLLDPEHELPAGPVKPAIAPEATTAPSAPGPELPHVVASQIESMQRLIPPTKSDSESASVGPKPTSIMAATLAIAIMGSFIWLNNYPNLAILSAAQKAGIEARMPSYVPASYRMTKQIGYGPGQVTLQFSSPGASDPLTITQRRTDWNSSALLEYFITPKTDSYLSVQSQGLTIYLYDKQNASWVNHGLQYVIEGSSRLTRDQIVKIAESL